VGRLCLYYRKPPEGDRWVSGDRYVRAIAKTLLGKTPRAGGVDKVFQNLCLGLDRLGVRYQINVPFRDLRDDDRVGVLGVGRYGLDGYDRRNPIVAGVALMTHPSEWPTLCDDYPVVRYLQHSPWAGDVYRPYFGDRVTLWPVGIDTNTWAPANQAKTCDFLVYDKIRWDHETTGSDLLGRVREELERRSLTWTELRYGAYDQRDFKARLDTCRAMIFLCEHESQGLAYQECLSSGVPILAWDQGYCLDPNRFQWGQPEIPATSVPFFNDRCGRRFTGPDEFATALDEFQDRLQSNGYSPRAYILENLTLERCSAAYVEIVNAATT
jgi:hypothetical protein